MTKGQTWPLIYQQLSLADNIENELQTL